MDDNGGRLFLRIEMQTARMGRRLCSAMRRSRSCQHREVFVGPWFEFWLNNKKEKRRVKKRGSIILMSAAGVFDETLDWSIFNDGEMCCEHPSVPLVSEVNVR